MKFLFLMFCALSLLLADSMNEKLVVFSDKDRKNSQENLLKLQVYFIENQKLRALNEVNHLNLELETLGVYTMVVIKPIESLDRKNTLLLELTPLFSSIFALENKTQQINYNRSGELELTLNPDTKINSVKIIIDEIGLQWIVLLVLSLLGLLLSIMRRKKMHSFLETQIDLDKDQMKMEDDIKKLGKQHV